jgi:putative phage-type endonuclease
MITDKQRDERAKGIGSSEVATILRMNRWQSPFDLWAVKTGRAPAIETNDAMRLGQVLEPTLLQLAGERLGLRVVRPSTTFVGHKPIYRANIDGMVGEARRGSDIVEVKTTGVTDGWGKEGTNEVPASVMCQVTYQMACSSSHLAHVACLSGAFGLAFKLYRVEWDADLAEYILDNVNAWWERHIVKDEPPEDTGSLDTLKSLHRTDEVKDMSGHLEKFQIEEAAKLKLVDAERQYEQAKASLVQALGNARRGETGPYSVAVTEVSTDRFDRKAFEAEHAELASRYIVPAGYKRIDIRKRKDA